MTKSVSSSLKFFSALLTISFDEKSACFINQIHYITLHYIIPSLSIKGVKFSRRELPSTERFRFKSKISSSKQSY